MSNNRFQIRGIGLLEVLVASTILAVGVVATFKCLGAMAMSQERAIDAETMQRLALQTYDQLIAEGTFTSGTQDGDFLDRGESRYIWHAEREPVSGGSLDVLKVEVDRKGNSYRRAQKIQGLICRPTGGGS